MKLTVERLFDNDSGGQNRQRIINALTDCPGLNFRRLAKAVGLANGTLRHHLRILERCQLVHPIRHGIHILHFTGEQPPTPEEIQAAYLDTLDDGARAVYEYVQAHPGQRQNAILEAINGQVRSTVQHRLQRLVRIGLLKRTAVGLQGVAYYPRPAQSGLDSANEVKPNAPDAPGFGASEVRGLDGLALE